MVSPSALVVPVLVSAVLVFVMSSLIHMASPWHKSDYPKFEKQDALLDAMRPLAPPPGDYFMPRADDMKDLGSAAFIEKMNKGPVVVMTVFKNGPMSMARNLSLWFAYSAVVAFFAAYVASRALGFGAPYLKVFQIVGTTAFLGYSGALAQMSIWYGRSWKMTLKSSLDGLIYAMLTAGAFGWLWPR